MDQALSLSMYIYRTYGTIAHRRSFGYTSLNFSRYQECVFAAVKDRFTVLHNRGRSPTELCRMSARAR